MSDKTKAEERREFIRRAAIRLDAEYMAQLMAQGREPTLSSPADIWAAARALWDAKPEDC